MVELSSSAIDMSCKMVRVYFPSSLVIQIVKDITGDPNLHNFPILKENEEKISKTKKRDAEISLQALKEIYTYFYEKQNVFLDFLKTLTSLSIQNQAINKVALDEFISKINTLLLKDSKIKIENYETIQKWVPNKAEKDIFLNINVPEYIHDYFTEGLDCSAHGLHRSSILFCTFSLEAALRYKYAELVDRNKAYRINFNRLIDWGTKNNLIEEDDFNKVNINFIRKYRNDLAHCNIHKPESKLKISRSYAQRMSDVVIYLAVLFINDMFY